MSDPDRRCKHMIRYPHECRDCEAEAYAAHRASGEGGPSSVLRTSAPEAFTVPTQAVIDARAALRELVACKDLHDSIERSGGDHEAAEYKRRKPLAWAEARRVLATPASEDASLSRGAAAPLAPEGQGETLCNRTACQAKLWRRWWNVSTLAWYCEACAAAINRANGSTLCYAEGKVPEMLAAGFYGPPQAQARTPSAAAAASPPEGIADEQVAAFKRAFHLHKERTYEDGLRVGIAAALSAAPETVDDPFHRLRAAEGQAMIDAAIARAEKAEKALANALACLDTEAETLRRVDEAEARAEAAEKERVHAQRVLATRNGELAKLRESWIAARQVVFATRTVLDAFSPDDEPHIDDHQSAAIADLRETTTAYDQRNHEAAEPEVVEIHAETLLRVVDYCRSDGPRSVVADCDAVLAFVAKATA